MPRKPRDIDPQGVYHILCRGNNRRQIFHDVDDYQRYISLLKKSKAEFGICLFHYVLMPNHVHLLLRPIGDLSKSMHMTQMTYAKKYGNKYQFKGHLWQGRFKAIPVENDAYLFACGNYIEMNPVRAGLTNTPEDWRWSSYGYYAFGEENELITKDPLFDSLANTADKRRRIYRELIDKTRS